MSDPTPWIIDTTNGQLYGSIVHIFEPTLDWVNQKSYIQGNMRFSPHPVLLSLAGAFKHPTGMRVEPTTMVE